MVPGSRVTEAGRPSLSSSCSGHGGEAGAWSRWRMALARVQLHGATCHVSPAHLTTWLCSWSTCAASHDPLPYLRTPYTDVPTWTRTVDNNDISIDIFIYTDQFDPRPGLGQRQQRRQ